MLVMMKRQIKIEQQKTGLIKAYLAAMALFGVAVFAVVAFGGVVSPVLASNHTAQDSVLRGGETAAENDGEPVDLTNLIKTIEDDDVAVESASTPAPTVNIISSNIVSSTAGLKRKDPSTIRLAALGNERDNIDGLGRLMWKGSEAATVVNLQSQLGRKTVPSALKPVVHHIMVARSVPPKGFVDLAEQMIGQRLDWLAAQGASRDLAELIRQLPEGEDWDKWHDWRVLHDLLMRNEEAACLGASRKVEVTLDLLWHQINAFCAVVDGDQIQASFALDLLEEEGVDDPLYFALMRRLTETRGGGDSDQISTEAATSPLNLALMDSARVVIPAEALQDLPQSYRQTVMALRHLSPQASRLLAARDFGHRPDDDLMASWALTPTGDVDAVEALIQFRFGDTADVVALSRLNVWQAISAEKDDRTQAQLALEALAIDYHHAGGASLELWLKFIEGGVDDLELEDSIGPLLGFAERPTKRLLNDTAAAWHDMLEFSRRPLSARHLNIAHAHDAIDLLSAAGQSTENQDWLQVQPDIPALAGGVSLPYAAVRSIEGAAANGLKAETLLRIAVVLSDVDLAGLTRGDAARITGALYQVGLKQSAQALARDILKSWGLNRHFAGTVKPAATKSGNDKS
jgi:hypothetical protein